MYVTVHYTSIPKELIEPIDQYDKINGLQDDETD
jgi:hypothetical protein